MKVSHVEKNFYEKLTSTEKYAIVVNWRAALFYLTNAETYLVTNKIENRKFFVGIEVEFPEDMFITFMPPGSTRLLNRFQRFLQGGIVQRWRKEYEGMASSPRVQDRNRLTSKTKVTLGKEVSPGPLALGGKLSKVFVLWFLCLSISATILLFEFLKCNFSTTLDVGK